MAWPFRVHGWDLFLQKLFPHHLCLLSQDTTELFKNRGEDHTCARKRKIIWGRLIHKELSLQECKKLIHTWRYIRRKRWKEFSAFCFKVYSLSKAHYDFCKFLVEIWVPFWELYILLEVCVGFFYFWFVLIRKQVVVW